MLIQKYDLNKNKSMNNIKIILIMLKYKYIPSNYHGYKYSYLSGGDVSFLHDFIFLSTVTIVSLCHPP